MGWDLRFSAMGALVVVGDVYIASCCIMLHGGSVLDLSRSRQSGGDQQSTLIPTDDTTKYSGLGDFCPLRLLWVLTHTVATCYIYTLLSTALTMRTLKG